MAFSSTAGRPIVVLCGAARRDDSSGDWDHAKGIMYFFDGETYEIIKKLELPDVTGEGQRDGCTSVRGRDLLCRPQ